MTSDVHYDTKQIYLYMYMVQMEYGSLKMLTLNIWELFIFIFIIYTNLSIYTNIKGIIYPIYPIFGTRAHFYEERYLADSPEFAEFY